MSRVKTILRELFGLFVDDGSLALALVLWCAAAGAGLPRLPISADWDAPILFIGCVVTLVGNVAVARRRRE